MIGIGCDLCKVDRMERALEKPRFLLRVFTPLEQKYIAEKGAQTAAGIWAAKEACAKALGSGFAGFSLTEIEVLHAENGKPQIALHGGAEARLQALGGTRAHISISHEMGLALAFCVLE